MKRLAAALAALFVLFALPAAAAPTFPPLTGRVVDEADLISPRAEQEMTRKLEALEQSTGRQLVVATLRGLQGYEIEEYGYQLGRAWGIGDAARDDGALLIVAPRERKVRIEVGYGLEPVLTDSLSSVIIQSRILPRFRDGDMEGGIVDGVDAIARQLALPEEEARATAAQAEAEPEGHTGLGIAPFFIFAIVFFFVVPLLGSLFGGRRLRRGFGGSALPWIVLGALHSASQSRGGGGWRSGGGGWSGGGFSGGGGSFGGGGASGGW